MLNRFGIGQFSFLYQKQMSLDSSKAAAVPKLNKDPLDASK
jgi:hypothetical protein